MRRQVGAALAGAALLALVGWGFGLRASGAGEPERMRADPLQAEASALHEAYRRVDAALYPPENPYSPAKADLGRRLFFDPLLSGGRTQSCAGCHVPARSWSDGRPLGVGETGAAMRVRTPTLLDVAQIPILGWDGKFRDLESVAFTPITSATAMNLPEATLLARLKAEPRYVRAFAAAFPDRGGDAVSRRTVELALATFQRSIVSGEAPFDRWVAGDTGAVSPSAKAGFLLFNGKAQCAACHSGWTFTDGSFHDIGVGTGTEIGRGAFFPNSVPLRYAFKTPTLRDVAERGPYMHDGSLATLREVLDLYDRGGIDRPSRSSAIRPLGLTEAEKGDLIAFLKTLSADGATDLAAPPRLN